MKYVALTTAMIAATATPLAAQNRIDGRSPLAPELAAYGASPVGVRRLDLVNPNQIDIRALYPVGEKPAVLPRYDRPLTVEMWYPAAQGATGSTAIDTILRDGITPVTLQGQAIRDAAPDAAAGPLPLVLMSHGYPGNRFLMSHLAENIASKGYVVASIDHTDSVYDDIGPFGSTLVNRPLDQLFVLDEMARLNADATSGFGGLIDADNTGLIGYSMGGYGAIITAGGGVTEASVTNRFAPPHETLAIHEAGSDTHEALPDPRIKTAVAIGPWGMNTGFFDDEGLAGIDIPMLFMAGSNDTVSRYEEGVRAIWEGATGVDRALLTFEGAGHNAAAPIPVPAEAVGTPFAAHYTDPVWDTVRMNNIAQHFVTAWMDTELKGALDRAAYLDLDPIGRRGTWLGFEEGEADGLRWEVMVAGQTEPSPVPLPASVWLLGLAVGGLGVMRKGRGRTA